ncbi:MAG: Rho termination factor (modular protein) [Actinomycetota bacterium]
MEQSEGHNRIIEHLRIKPISHSQIYTYQIAVPESQRGEIPQERREALRRSLLEQGSNLMPLIVRRTEAYSNEEEYEVVHGADWCIVAQELNIDQLWAWIFEMTDEEATAAKAEMESLALVAPEETTLLKSLLQQLEVSFQEKVDTLTKKIEQAVKKNEDILKKQVKALAERNSDTDQIEQIKNLIERLEKTFHEKVDNLAKKITQTGPTLPSAVNSEINLESALRQLEELEKLLERKIERTVQAINQYVADSIQSIEDDLKNQISAIRRELGTSSKPPAKVQAKAQPKPEPEAELEVPVQPKSRSKAQPKTSVQAEPKPKEKAEPKSKTKSQPQPAASLQEDYDSLSLRKLKLIGKQRKLRGYARMKRPEILAALKKADSGK